MVPQDINQCSAARSGCQNYWLLRYTLTLLFIFFLFTGCSKKPVTKILEATAYCGCSSCCSWQRGSDRYLRLDFWNKYVSEGNRKGSSYSGKTSSGTFPEEPREGLFSMDSIQHPWIIPVRVLFFPWYLLPEDGTIAADTRFYPFGTRMYIPGYGWGVVEDRGGAIKGPDRIDLYFKSHDDALKWGRQKVRATIEYSP